MSGGVQIKHRIEMFIVLRTLLAEVAGTSQTEVSGDCGNLVVNTDANFKSTSEDKHMLLYYKHV